MTLKIDPPEIITQSHTQCSYCKLKQGCDGCGIFRDVMGVAFSGMWWVWHFQWCDGCGIFRGVMGVAFSGVWWVWNYQIYILKNLLTFLNLNKVRNNLIWYNRSWKLSLWKETIPHKSDGRINLPYTLSDSPSPLTSHNFRRPPAVAMSTYVKSASPSKRILLGGCG